MYNIIVNETSGGGHGARTLKKMKLFFSQRGIEYKVFSTLGAGDAEEYAREISSAATEKPVNIIAVGGDGTFHEVINGIVDFDNTVVGFVPSGRGNDFARAVGLSKNPHKALEAIVSGRQKNIDLLEVANRRTLNVGGTGLDIEVLERVIKNGNNGKLNYVFALMACLKKFEPYKIKVSLDGGEPLEREVILVTTCNGTCFGGGIKISPLSKVDDDTMDVVIINMVKRSKIPFIFASFLKGKHIVPRLADYAEYYTCKTASITNASSNKVQLDGEIYTDLSYNAKILKGALRTVGI